MSSTDSSKIGSRAFCLQRTGCIDGVAVLQIAEAERFYLTQIEIRWVKATLSFLQSKANL